MGCCSPARLAVGLAQAMATGAWSMRLWLEGLGLERFSENFEKNDISADILQTLTKEDFVALGVTAIGDRRRLIVAIGQIRPAAEQPYARRVVAPTRRSTARSRSRSLARGSHADFARSGVGDSPPERTVSRGCAAELRSSSCALAGFRLNESIWSSR